MEMNLTKKQKRYLRENFRYKSNVSLAKQLGVSEEYIHQALKQLNLKRTEAELQALQDSENKKKPKKNKIGVKKILFFHKPLFFILMGALAALLIFFYTLTQLLSTKEAKYISDIKKLMSLRI